VITLKLRELQVILTAKLPVPSHLNREVPFAVLSNSNPLGSFNWSIEPAKPAGVLTPKVSEKLYIPGYPTTGLELYTEAYAKGEALTFAVTSIGLGI
jgi:hypothetical protein